MLVRNSSVFDCDLIFIWLEVNREGNVAAEAIVRVGLIEQNPSGNCIASGCWDRRNLEHDNRFRDGVEGVVNGFIGMVLMVGVGEMEEGRVSKANGNTMPHSLSLHIPLTLRTELNVTVPEVAEEEGSTAESGAKIPGCMAMPVGKLRVPPCCSSLEMKFPFVSKMWILW